MRFIKILWLYLAGAVGILLVSIVPTVVLEKGLFHLPGYYHEFLKLVTQLVHLDKWVMKYKNALVPIKGVITEPYIFSISALLISIAAGLLTAFLAAFLTLLQHAHVRVKAIRTVNAVPIIWCALLLQLGFVIFIKKLGISADGHSHNAASIMAVSILPAMLFYKQMLNMTAGQSSDSINIRYLAVYLFREKLREILQCLKSVLFLSVLSLFLVEYLLLVKGISFYMTLSLSPIVIAVSLLLLYTPLYIIYQSIEILQDKEKANAEGETSLVKYCSYFLKSLKAHFGNPKFATGFLFLFGLVVYSICYSQFKEVPIKQVILLMDGKGHLLSAPPHPPSAQLWFGSDFGGRSIGDQMAVGAKFTIIFGLLIALLRVTVGFLMAIFYTFHLKEKTRVFINKLVDSIHFVPLTLIAVILLSPKFMGSGLNALSTGDRVFQQILILTVLAVPLTTVLIGNEMKIINQQMYIESAKILGGDNRHILWKHIVPHLAPRLFMLFGQQFNQVLLIFVHLGVFEIFFGTSPYEWSYMLAMAKDAFFYEKFWLVIPVMIAFLLSILAMQLLVQGVKEVQQRKVGVLVPKREKIARKKSAECSLIQTDTSFTFKTKHQSNISGS